MTRLSVTEEDRGDYVLIAAEGEVDVSTAPDLNEVLQRELERGRPVVVSLEKVEFLDSRGIGVLVAATRRARESGLDVAVVVVRPAQLHSIRVLRLDTYLTLAASVDEARDALAGGRQ